MLIDMAKLRLIQKLLKSKWTGSLVSHLSTEYTFHKNMRNIWFDKLKYDLQDMKPHWELLVAGNGRKVLPVLTRYIDQRQTYYERWIGGLSRSKLPFHILWAANDPIAVLGMAYKLNNTIYNSSLSIIEECGHFPMIEKEEEWSNNVLNFIHKLNHF
jgi:pimeloyl-ACP methyl ester carboxylesterase